MTDVHESWHRMTVWKCPLCDVVDGSAGAKDMPLCIGPTLEPHPPTPLQERLYVAADEPRPVYEVIKADKQPSWREQHYAAGGGNHGGTDR
jgi:hypothetical protein